MRKCRNPYLSSLVIPDSFAECLSYAQRQNWLYKKISELEERVEALEGNVESNDEDVESNEVDDNE